MREPDRADVVRQLRELGVSAGAVLLVHASFRAVRPVLGGPDGLIDALVEAVGDNGTVVMPSWPKRSERGFDPAVDPAAPDLGVVADRFWRRPGVLRANHPAAFAALGPDAAAVLRDPLPLPPHVPESPVGRVRDLDGSILLLGVDHDANTTIHLAELEGGARYRVPKHCFVRSDGVIERIEYGENDHCCARFRLVDGWLDDAGAQRHGPVGRAEARLTRSRDVVRVVTGRLRSEPETFLHPLGSGCAECDEAWHSLRSAQGLPAAPGA